MGDEYNRVEVGHAECLVETDKAICVYVERDDDEEVWVPKSQLHDDSEVFKKGDAGELVVLRFIARQRGWD